MPITDYATLQATVSRWAAGSSDPDLPEAIKDSIGLTEAELSSRLRVAEMEVRSLVVVSGEIAKLPSGVVGELVALRSVSRMRSGYEEPMVPVAVDSIGLYSRGYPAPSYYVLEGNQLRLAPAPTSDVTLRLSYYAHLPRITDDNPCPAALLRYQDCYLYGSLKHLASYLVDDKLMQRVIPLYEQAIRTANRASMFRDAGYGG